MGTIPTPPTFTAGAVLTATQQNTLRDSINFLLNPPQCEAYATAVLSTTSGTEIVVPLAGEVFDIVQSGDSPMHDNTTNNTRIVCRTPGKYWVSGQISYAANTGGTVRHIHIRMNSGGSSTGGTLVAITKQGPIASGTVSTSAAVAVRKLAMTAGDYIEMFAFQNSGVALDAASGVGVTFLTLVWAGS